MNVWNPRVQKDELSKSLISISASNSANKIVDSIEVNPRMNGDFETRDFHAWTVIQNNGYKKVCYNLQCGGFVQVSKKIAAGGVQRPYSTYGSAPYTVDLTIRQDSVTGHFSNEGFGKASMIFNMFIVDEHNKDQRPSLVDHMTHPKCYDVKHLPSDHSSGMNLYFGGPGINKNCR
ncbi:hypothetical protein ACFE04_000151 [Oxalis oulophora]